MAEFSDEFLRLQPDDVLEKMVADGKISVNQARRAQGRVNPDAPVIEFKQYSGTGDEINQSDIYRNTVKAFKENQSAGIAYIEPYSRESSEPNFYAGVVTGLVVATLFWVLFATGMWLILR